MLVEHLDRILGDHASRLVVAARQREELRQGQARLEQTQAGRDELGILGRVARLAVVWLRHQQAFAHDRFEDRTGNAGTCGELVESERLPELCLRDGGGEGHVGRVELAREHPSDDRE